MLVQICAVICCYKFSLIYKLSPYAFILVLQEKRSNRKTNFFFYNFLILKDHALGFFLPFCEQKVTDVKSSKG